VRGECRAARCAEDRRSSVLIAWTRNFPSRLGRGETMGGRKIISWKDRLMLKLVGRALPFVAALGFVIGLSTLSARAAEEGGEKKEGKGNIAGTVTDKDGKAVEGVEVRLMKPRQRGGGGGGGSGAGGAGGGGNAGGGGSEGKATIGSHGAITLAAPPPIATATTDKDGKFTMNDVATGDYNIGVRDDAKKVYGRSKVTVEDGKTATVEIKCTDTPPQRGGGGGGGGGGAGGGGGGAGGGGAPKQ
jgi:hypothetical protein